MVKESIKPFLISELFNVQEYLKRLIHFSKSISFDEQNIKNMISHFNEIKKPSIETNFHLNFEDNTEKKSLEELKQELFDLIQFLQASLKITKLNEHQKNIHLAALIDFYDLCSNIHYFIDAQNRYNLERPRLILMQSNDDSPIRYKVNYELIDSIENDGQNILSLGPKKVEKYHDYIKQAKEAVNDKDYESAKSFVERAISMRKTSEAYTFLGWIYSLEKNFDRAIENCEIAIDLDPDFGNPYNDIGSYLLVQQKVTESLPWFRKAQAAAKYSNREYPYINLGKALVMLGKYSMALEQFYFAKKLVPQNKDVVKTIEKIESIIHRSNQEIQQ